MRFNSLQFNSYSSQIDTAKYTHSVLEQNEKIELVSNLYKEYFERKKVKNFSFSEDGFFSVILSLKGKIAVSLGESEFIVTAAKRAREFGANIEFISLKKDGTLDISNLDDSFDFIFVSSYIVDTYLKVELSKIKEKTNAKIISNATVDMSKESDIYLLDSYKLCGLGDSGVLIFNDEFEENSVSLVNLIVLELTLKAYQDRKMLSSLKEKFLLEFQNIFKDELFIFVEPNRCLDYTLHLGLKDIKMRDIIRTLAFEDILITNGEGCSLGLSKPSRILQEMGYSQDESRWGLSLDFSEELSEEAIKTVVEKIYKKYRQIKVLG